MNALHKQLSLKISMQITWKHTAWVKANSSNAHNIEWGIGLSKFIRVRYEKGVLKPLEPIELEEGEEAQVIVMKAGKDSTARRFYGIVKRHTPWLSRDEFLEMIEGIENEDVRGF